MTVTYPYFKAISWALGFFVFLSLRVSWFAIKPILPQQDSSNLSRKFSIKFNRFNSWHRRKCPQGLGFKAWSIQYIESHTCWFCLSWKYWVGHLNPIFWGEGIWMTQSSKVQMHRGLPGGRMLELQIDWHNTYMWTKEEMNLYSK